MFSFASLRSPIDTLLRLLGVGGGRLVAHPTYSGECTLAHLRQLHYQTDAQPIPVAQVIAHDGSKPRWFGRELPFANLDIDVLAPAELHALLHQYDANDNGYLEQPEITLLYVIELARAVDIPVRGVMLDGRPVRALQVSSSERDRLVRFSSKVRARFNAAGRKLFDDLDQLGVRCANEPMQN